MRGPVIDRLMARIAETAAGCWIFQGAISAAGYGVIGMGGRADGTDCTHRVAHRYFISEIPAGLDLDHLCRVRSCCNPWHLEPVTRLVNANRGLRAKGFRATHCKHGHEFTPENTVIATLPGTDIFKQQRCLACAKRRAAA